MPPLNAGNDVGGDVAKRIFLSFRCKGPVPRGNLTAGGLDGLSERWQGFLGGHDGVTARA